MYCLAIWRCSQIMSVKNRLLEFYKVGRGVFHKHFKSVAGVLE